MQSENKLQRLAKLKRKAQCMETQIQNQVLDLARLRSVNDLLARLSWKIASTHVELVGSLRADGAMARREFIDSYGRIMTLADTILEQAEDVSKSQTRGFLNDLSKDSRQVLLDFVNTIRRDHNWVCKRLSRLSSTDLEELLPSAELGSGQTSSCRETTRRMDVAEDLQQSDVLYSLVFGMFSTPGMSASEDELRRDLSAAIMIQLIQDSKTSSKGDKVGHAIMDSWSAMYGFAACKDFEILLLNILQKGTLLLDRMDTRTLANQQHHSRPFYVQPRRDEAEEEFFSDSLRRILQLLDRQEVEALPVGAVLLCRAVLSRVASSERRHCETFMISNWFLGCFVSRLIMFPERFGILLDHHITEAQRVRILQVLQERLWKSCNPSAGNPQPSKGSTHEEEIEGHILSIFAKFRGNNKESPRDITYLNPTDCFARRLHAAAQSRVAKPFIYISSLQIIRLHVVLCSSQRAVSPEMLNSVPTRHPSTSSTSSFRSLSLPSRPANRVVFDIGPTSVQEHTVSGRSDSQEQLEPHEGLEVYLAIDFFKLRSCIESLPHPAEGSIDNYSELLVVSCDNVEDDRDDFVVPKTVDVRQDVVKSAVSHLVMHFELVNPAHTQNQSTSYFGGHRHPQNISEGQSLLHQILSAGKALYERRDYPNAELYYGAYAILQKKISTPEALENFSPLLHGYCDEYEAVIEDSDPIMDALVNAISHADEYRAKLSQKIDDQISCFGKLRLRMWYHHEVRNSKAWHRAWEVVKGLLKMQITSLPAKNTSVFPVDRAAHHIGMMRSTSRDKRFPRLQRDYRPTSPGLNSLLSDLHTVDSGIYEALTGSAEEMVPNKLSHEQSTLAQTWLRTADIQNLCCAEERIHRFCFEVDELIKRFTKVTTHPLDEIDMIEASNSPIWRGEFFAYESTIFDIKLPAHTSRTSTYGAQIYEELGLSGLLRRGSAGDLLHLSKAANRSRGHSVGSLDAPQARAQLSRASSNSILIDIEAITESRGQKSSMSSIEPSLPFTPRPLSREMKHIGCPMSADDQAIKDFLLQTQLGLTTLLLSEFSGPVFHQGSETDEWLSVEMTDLLQQIKAMQASAERATTKVVLRPLSSSSNEVQTDLVRPKHVRKKSSSVSQFFNGRNTCESLKSALVPPAIDVGDMRSSRGVVMERMTSTSSSCFEMSTSSDFSVTPSTPWLYSDHQSRPQIFAWSKAYREIMHRFSTVPAPYEKLRALYEFELLVVASLEKRQDACQVGLPKLAPAMPATPLVTAAKGHAATTAAMKTRARQDSIDLTKARVEDLSISPLPGASGATVLEAFHESASYDVNSPGADTIVEEMQRLLRDPDIRPKSLFRDLQFIASFIPNHILNMTDEGKVFWDFTLAAIAIKQGIIDTIMKYVLSTKEHDLTRHTHLGACQIEVNRNKVIASAARENHNGAIRELSRLLAADAIELVLPPFSDPGYVHKRTRGSDDQYGLQSSKISKEKAASLWLDQIA